MEQMPILTQGCRRDDRTWQQNTCDRICAIPRASGPVTLKCEVELGLNEASYFYVSAISERYDRAVVSWLAADDAADHVAPFDTGAIASRKFAIRPSLLNQDDLRDFVNRNTWTQDVAWIDAFWKWVGVAFSSRGSASNEVPSHHFCPEFQSLERENWFWEARVENENLPEADMIVESLFLTDADRIELDEHCAREVGSSLDSAHADEVLATLDFAFVEIPVEEDQLDFVRRELAGKMEGSA